MLWKVILHILPGHIFSALILHDIIINYNNCSFNIQCVFFFFYCTTQQCLYLCFTWSCFNWIVLYHRRNRRHRCCCSENTKVYMQIRVLHIRKYQMTLIHLFSVLEVFCFLVLSSFTASYHWDISLNLSVLSALGKKSRFAPKQPLTVMTDQPATILARCL